jgi:hypothetical protein
MEVSMDLQLTPIARANDQRLVAVCGDGSLHIVWGEASFRIPIYDLSHLTTVLSNWEDQAEIIGMRRGYYRLLQAPEGGMQLWLNNAGLWLSREDLRIFSDLLHSAELFLADEPDNLKPAPFNQDYRVLNACSRNRFWKN